MSDLLDWSVPVAWHEATAVVRQTGLILLAARTPQAAPELAHLWLSSDGTLRLEPSFGGEGDVAPSLARLLGQLLTPSAPQDLAAMADISKVSDMRPQEFVDVLTFFCRPDDNAELRTLAARAVDARATSERAAALQALTDRARHTAPSADVPSSSTRKFISTRQLAVIAGVVTVVLLGTAMLWAAMRRDATTPSSDAAAPSSLERVASRVQDSVATATAFVKETLGTPEVVPAGRGADLKLPAKRASRRAPAAVAAPVTIETPVSTVPTPVVAAPAASDVAEPVEMVAPLVDSVFSAANADVAPPVLARPQMPESQIAGLPQGRPGVLELVVGRDGQVMSARLVPRSNRHQDRMMVSAAKAWRFAPAIRDGQAVSYRLQLPITW